MSESGRSCHRRNPTIAADAVTQPQPRRRPSMTWRAATTPTRNSGSRSSGFVKMTVAQAPWSGQDADPEREDALEREQPCDDQPCGGQPQTCQGIQHEGEQQVEERLARQRPGDAVHVERGVGDPRVEEQHVERCVAGGEGPGGQWQEQQQDPEHGVVGPDAGEAADVEVTAGPVRVVGPGEDEPGEHEEERDAGVAVDEGTSGDDAPAAEVEGEDGECRDCAQAGECRQVGAARVRMHGGSPVVSR